MPNSEIEVHPLGFFLPEGTRLLMLGSFPPPMKRWSMPFYYPNIQNDMWRILGLIFHDDINFFLDTPRTFSLDKAQAFCREQHIGIGDTAMKVRRLKDNASDQFLEIIEPIHPAEVLARIPQCEAIVVTGTKATDTLLSVLPQMMPPAIGSFTAFSLLGRSFKLYRMPSSSRAYPKPIAEKADLYRKMFQNLGMIPH